VHDGVDLLAAQHLRDDRVTDVGPHELGPAEIPLRHHRVDADHDLDVGGCRQDLGESTTEVASHPGDEHTPSHGSLSPSGEGNYFLLRR
jgi:hypothetical protein